MEVQVVSAMLEMPDGEVRNCKMGYRITLDDVHSDLREGQAVYQIPRNLKRGVEPEYKDYFAHGSRFYFSRRHKSFSHTSPCMVLRNRLNQVTYYRGRPVVLAPNKQLGIPVDEFMITYGTFGLKVMEVLKAYGELK